jgi:G6PDH family F420-dependent oxidoreductase
VLGPGRGDDAAMFEGASRLGVGHAARRSTSTSSGDAWPTLDVRLEMLEEAVEVMRALWTGEPGAAPRPALHRSTPARLLHAARVAPPRFLVLRLRPRRPSSPARIGDGYVNVDPSEELVRLYRDRGGKGPTQGGVKVCWSPDEATARRHVHELWALQAIPGEAMQVLPSPVHFEQISELVPEEMAVDAVGAVGNRVDDFVEAVRPYVEAGFDEVYIGQIGPEQDGWYDFWERELRPALAGM